MYDAEGGVPVKTQRMTLCALFAALTALCAQIALPIGPVPVNLGLLPLLAAALLLPAGYAVTTALVYLGMGAAGLPVFAGMAGGLGTLLGATGGYLLGYVLCTALVAWLTRRKVHPVLSMALGIAACYVPGTLWLMHTAHLSFSQALMTGTLPFIPGDGAKMVAAYALAKRLKKALK